MSVKKTAKIIQLVEAKNQSDRLNICSEFLREFYSEDQYLQVLAFSLAGNKLAPRKISSRDRGLAAKVMLEMHDGKTYFDAIADTAELNGISETTVKNAYAKAKDLGLKVTTSIYSPKTNSKTGL